MIRNYLDKAPFWSFLKRVRVAFESSSDDELRNKKKAQRHKQSTNFKDLDELIND